VALAGEPGVGPDVVVLGGLHGNEPEGLAAGEAVVRSIEASGLAPPGRIAVLAGNLGALRAGQRYLDRDLNRAWGEGALARVRARRAHERSREDREQLDLIACFEALAGDGQRGLILLDLHTTSGEAPPFSVLLESPRNARLAAAIGHPMILGFEAQVQSPILSWFDARGWAAVGVEGGSYGDTSAGANLVEAVWRLLGILGWPHEQAEVAASSGTAYRIAYRHPVVPGSGFRMEPGFESFQAVRAGALLARDCTGAIRAMCDGLIFMPLYQAQGSDGFFLLSAAESV